MNEDARDCLNNTNNENKSDAVYRLLMEKEELVSRQVHEWDQLSRDKSTFDRTLWILREEMLHLMQCDVQLWKTLRELNASLAKLKEDIIKQKVYRDRSDSVSSASSGTDSFVSAEEYNDVISTDTAENRVSSWINTSDFSNNGTGENIHGPRAVNYRPRSRTCSDISSDRNRKLIFRGHLHETHVIEKLVNSFRIPSSVSNLKGIYIGSSHCSAIYLQDVFNSYTLDPFLVNSRKAHKMKSTEDIEIVQRGDFTYYKSSLRLLGSVRMQSRIFEPSLTKWRPFALSQTPDSYIIVPPKAFSSIQPRPRLHRLANSFDGGALYLHTVSSDTKETEDGDKPKIEENKINKHLEETEKSQTSLSAENGELEHSVERVRSELIDKIDVNDGFKSATKRVSETEIEFFSSDFLEMKDGLITCRILIPEIEQELEHSVLQQDEFEYLTIVDGRVTFTPHTKDTENDDPYFLGWLFENNESGKVEESFYINRLFEGTEDEEIDDWRDGYNLISYVIKDIHQESETMSEESTHSYSPVFHDMNVHTAAHNKKNTDSFSNSHFCNEEDDENLSVKENRNAKALCHNGDDLNTIASQLQRNLDNGNEHQNHECTADQNDGSI